ncbi:MAG TPA: PAS domain S-box protein [Chloroflexia bacterium]
MKTALDVSAQAQQVLLQLMEQVQNAPETLPDALLEQFPPGSEERRLLEGFAGLLLRARQTKSRLAQIPEVEVSLSQQNRPSLSEQRAQEREEQYQAVFEATSDGLVINDMNGIVVAVNTAFCDMHGYSREEFIGSDLTRLHPPGSRPVYWEYLDTVRDGRVFMTQEEHIHQRKDGTLFYVEVHGSKFNLGGEPHILGVVRDVTERVRAYELLEQRVEERTRELSTLLEVSSNITSTLALKPLMIRILDQLKVISDYDSASISVLNGDKLSFLELRGSTGDTLGIEWSLPVGKLGVIWETLCGGSPVIIPDVHGTSPMALAFQEAVGADFGVGFEHIHSWLAVPLVSKEAVIGLLALSHIEPNRYQLHDAGLGMAIGNQAAISIENARLYEQAQETAQITGALSQTASRVAYGGSLVSTLGDICHHVVHATSAVAAAVVLFGDGGSEPGPARFAGAYGLPEDYVNALNKVLSAGAEIASIQALMRREVSVVDARANPRMPALMEKYPDFETTQRYIQDGLFETFVSVPLVYGDNLGGGLIVYYPQGVKVDDNLLAFQAAIADQTAVAVENTRLLAQVQEKAALEQRQYLARELHDSVTQGLFSMNLITRSIEVMMEREGSQSAEITKKISYLRQLTQGALAEMRALIFELRPGALEEEGLVEAIRKHAAAVQSRDVLQIEVISDKGEIPKLKPAVEEALYRISQEALHNIVKHAKASKVTIRVQVEGDWLILEVVDDGVGFDVEKVPAGHMGLGTMGQRTQALNGEYRVVSVPGMGTTVRVRLPLAHLQ